MQIYAEAESRANEFIQIAMPRRNSISAAGKYTQKPRASYSGKVPLIRGKMVHFPGKNGENGGRINIFEGKVPLIRGNLVHFPSSGWTMPLPVSHIMSTVKSVHCRKQKIKRSREQSK